MMASSCGVNVGWADLMATKYLVFSRRFVNTKNGRGLKTPPPMFGSARRGNHDISGDTKLRDDRRVIAVSDVFLDDAAPDGVEDALAREDVVEAPADVALAHVAPWRPPR